MLASCKATDLTLSVFTRLNTFCSLNGKRCRVEVLSTIIYVLHAYVCACIHMYVHIYQLRILIKI